MFGTFAINLLPILNTVVTFVQQKMISNASKGQETNTTMQSMMYTMPVLMLVLFYNMPSGVTLYYLISGILSVAQQYFIMKGRN
jgi:YidC/Oxa1 family membrane protein insertase